MNKGSWVATGVLNEYAPAGLLDFKWLGQTERDCHKQKDEMELIIGRAPFYKIYKRGNEGWLVWG